MSISFKRQMRRSREGVAAVAVLSLLLFSCAKKVERLPTAALSEVFIEHLQKIEDLKTIAASAVLQVKFKGLTRIFQLAIASRLPDRIRVEFVDPLIGPLAAWVINKDKMVLLDPIGGDLLQEREADLFLRELMHFPWEKILAGVKYGEYRKFGKRSLPTHISVENGRSSFSLHLEVKELEIGVALDPNIFKVDSNMAADDEKN